MNRDGVIAPYEETYYDFDQTGKLSDSERDEDADGLTNWSETRGCMNPVYWSDVYDKETPYYIDVPAAPSSTTRTPTATACATAPTTRTTTTSRT